MSGLLQASPPPSPMLAPPPARADRRPTASWAARRAACDRVLDEELFRGALVRERRRADRFEDAIVVTLVSRDEDRGAPPTWDDILDSLDGAPFEEDLLGWYRRGSVLGLIRLAGGRQPGAERESPAAAMLYDLRRSLPAGLTEGRAVRIETYDPRGSAAPPLFIEDVERRRTAGDRARAAAKRVLDIAGSVTLLVLLAPLMLGVALAVKTTSRGPIIHRQVRVGRDGRQFPMLKFRTMQADAMPTLHRQYVEHFIQAGARQSGGAETTYKMVNDPRVTSIGRWLRRSSVDEVPQLLNVLAGDMSLVGPRPPLPYELERYKSWHRRRVLEAKPGMTGLWQVTGRSRTSFDEMVRLDLRYARSRSLLTDLKILLATPRAVLSGKGAY